MTARPQPGFEAIMADMQKATVDAQLARLEAAMEELARNNETLKSRIQNVESTAPSYNNRLGQLERSIRPYDEYSEQCNSTIDQFKKIKVRLEAERNAESKRNQAMDSRLDDFDHRLQTLNSAVDRIPTVFDDQHNVNNSVQWLLSRVQQLEQGVSNQSDRPRLKTLSAQDLAKALVDRLSLGDSLDDPTLVQLALLLTKTSPVAPPPGRLPFTPSTDVESAKPAIGESSTERGVPRSRKRSRKSYGETGTVTTTTAEGDVSLPKKRRGRPSKSAAGTGNGNSAEMSLPDAVEEVEQDEDQAEVEDQRGASPTQIRRSGREPKPTSKHGEYLTWKQVRDQRRETG